MAFVDTEQRPAGEVQQKVGRIKLSEAIRIGARIRPQGIGAGRDNGTSCALQAAAEAITGRLYKWTLDCREALGITPALAREIWLMNDDLRLTREQIADLLSAQGL